MFIDVVAIVVIIGNVAAAIAATVGAVAYTDAMFVCLKFIIVQYTQCTLFDTLGPPQKLHASTFLS